MNKKLYSLIALGTFLFAAACSDNDSPVSGSTSIPNMSKSPVLCSVMGVTDSLEALEKGCIWSPEMWGPTMGYRVRTGYDNGTNTSGIWTVSTYPENAYVDMIWPGNATTEYDSMALADVIDKCGGSLCGKVLYKGKNSIPENEYHPNCRREVYFDFNLAGKDASGKTVGYVISITNADGYDGTVTISMGLDTEGTITGIAFTELHETPGMGMLVDEPAFKGQFNGRNVEAFELLKKGGSTADTEIDSVSGASTTSGAVVNAVNAGLDFFRTVIVGGGD